MGSWKGLYLLVLDYLRNRPSAAFSELCRVIGMTKGACGNYLKYLIEKGWIEKIDVGVYSITEEGLRILENERAKLHLIKEALRQCSLIMPEDAGTIDAFIVELEAKPRIDANTLINHLGWLSQDAGFIELGSVDGFEDRFREAAVKGFNRLHYVINGNHFFNIFDPPGYNIIIRLDGDGSGIGVWTGVLGPHEFFNAYKPLEGDFMVRLAIAYSVYYLHLLDSMIRVRLDSRLFVKYIVILKAVSGGSEVRDARYVAARSDYDVEDLINDLINVPKGEGLLNKLQGNVDEDEAGP
ncbi:MarR family transcriptional regulator [Caldivirga sp.]|uniref:MarR family transcriptional regulator n=1 Tax=Caldivirga sp. TaxID=2080243 RepID=UPI003D11CD20